ncbi:MAG: RluA family pseudouridine synthase [Patescibacteria group bacterium]
MSSKILKATAEDTDTRLDKFLIDKIDASRSEIQRRIRAGAVLVNEKKVAPHHFLRAGDIIKIGDPTPPPLTKGRSRTLPPTKGELEGVTNANINIIYESPDYLVVIKPAGLLIHQEPTGKGANLADVLVKKFPELKKVGDKDRPGIVHRLDKEVSGLVLIPRTPAAYGYFKEQFAGHKIKKEYVALVYGELSRDFGDIGFKIGRAKTGKMAARPKGAEEGKEALTKFDVIKRFNGYTLLKLTIITGRTHQIRVHLLALGHPLVGDELYGKASGKFKRIKLNRIFLHAKTLGFFDQRGGWQEFHKDIPDELKKILKQLK